MSAGRIVAVCTNADTLDDVKTGLWLEELAAPYDIWTAAGYQVDIASVKGGKIPLDPNSTKKEMVSERSAKFMKDLEAMSRLQNSKPVTEVMTTEYDVIYFPGGHGTMKDFPNNPALCEKIEAAWKQGKIVSAVCHGPAAFVGPKIDGKPLVDGKELTSFSNEEERELGYDKKVPFLLEDKLKELGAKYKSAGKWEPFVVCDGQLITGQNPKSSEKLARCVLETLKPSVK